MLLKNQFLLVKNEICFFKNKFVSLQQRNFEFMEKEGKSRVVTTIHLFTLLAVLLFVAVVYSLMDRRITYLNGEVDKFGTKFDSLENVVSKPDTTIINACDLNGVRIDSLRGRLNGLSRKVNELESEIDDINKSLDAVFD